MASAKGAFALPAADEESVIRSRFLTQASVSRGEPPLRKLTKRFLQLCDEAERGTVEATEDALRTLLREISLMELHDRKLAAVCNTNIQEQAKYAEKQKQLLAEIEQAKKDIETKKKELQDARIVRQHKEEYEVLRHLIQEHPSRAQTQKEIDRIQKQIQSITSEGTKIASIMQKRRKQFALLFHVIEELQRTGGDEPDEATATPQDADTQQMDVDT